MIHELNEIELHKENMKFSAAHFTIFSATERENLHGHNYSVHAVFVTDKNENGLSFDYRFYKDKLRALCQTLDEFVIIPGLSKHLTIAESDHYFQVTFAQEEMRFLKRDVMILPISNTTVEELSDWFLNKLIQDESHLLMNHISEIRIKISSAPGQSGTSIWSQHHE